MSPLQSKEYDHGRIHLSDHDRVQRTFVYKTPDQGAATTLVAAVAPEFARTGGHYLDDCREAHLVPDDADPTAAGNAHGVKSWALDPDAAARLWDVSTALLGLRP